MDERNNPTPRTSYLRALIHEHWQPKPISPPTVDPELETLTGAQRSAEVIRYSILSLEWWLSPFGRLREWVRLNSKLCAVLLVPAVLVLPLISWIIYLISGWVVMLVSLAGNLILLPIVALLAVGTIAVAVAVLRAVSRR